MSVWMKRMRQEPRLCCVVVLEPVERVSAWVSFQSDVSLHEPDHIAPQRVTHFVPTWASGQQRRQGSGGSSLSAEPLGDLALGQEPHLPMPPFPHR